MLDVLRGTRAVVVGGGIKGLIAARLLAGRGASVTLIERGSRLGGIHNSIPWGGFKLDAGCHLFGNEDNKTTKLLLDLMREAPNPVNPVLRSRINGRSTDGIEYPDFTSLPASEHKPALAELVALAKGRGSGTLVPPLLSENLERFLTHRYGAPAAALLDRAISKLTRAPLRELSAAGFSATPASRIKLTSDHEAQKLKLDPAIDEILLQSSADEPMQFLPNATILNARCFYPAGGAGAFTENAVARLKELGVAVRTDTPISELSEIDRGISVSFSNGEAIEADAVMWSAGAEALSALMMTAAGLGSAVKNVPLILFYFDIAESDAGPFSWVQDFDSTTHIYRASVPSRFGPGTAPQGRAYVVAEVPTETDSDIFANPENYAGAVWDEITSMGVASGPLPGHRKTLKFPVAFRFPKAGYAAAVAPLTEKLKQFPRLMLIDEWVFGNAASVRHVDEMLAAFNTMETP